MAKSIKWLGHAAFMITSAQDKVIFIDPFIMGNPLCPITVDDITQANLVLVTHDHFDHVGSAVDIANKTGAQVIAQPETVGRFTSEMGLAASQVVNLGMGMNIGGTCTFDGITITMTQAFHSSGTGSNTGFIIKLEDGFTIYHAGDTGIFEGMRLLGEIYSIDLALLPTGSTFTMDSYQAAKALTLLRPKKVIPMHYKTFPVLEQGTDRFIELAKKEASNVQVIIAEPGQEIAL